jgi:hypothetical protein
MLEPLQLETSLTNQQEANQQVKVKMTYTKQVQQEDHVTYFLILQAILNLSHPKFIVLKTCEVGRSQQMQIFT